MQDDGTQMTPQNCWEFMKCGRETGGVNEKELGACPAYTDKVLDGVHGGMSGGRACWVVAGTFCWGKVQGTYAEKEKNCLGCEFHMLVRQEHTAKGDFKMLTELLEIIMKQR